MLSLTFIFLLLTTQPAVAEQSAATKQLYSASNLEECERTFPVVNYHDSCKEIADGINNWVLIKKEEWQDFPTNIYPEKEILEAGFAQYSSTPCGSSFSLKQNIKWENVDQATFCTTIMQNIPFYIWQGGCC